MTIIFDLDGTLLDTIRDLMQATNHALEKNHLAPLDVEAYKLLVGNGVRSLAERATAKSWLLWSSEQQAEYMKLAVQAGQTDERYTELMQTVSYTEKYKDVREVEVPKSLVEAVYADFMSYYSQHSTDETQPYEGIVELLEELKARGHQLAVLSNKADPLTQAVVKFYFKPAVFDAVRGMKEGIPAKPDPTGAILLAEELGVEADSVFYVGDTMTDMKTAVSAGMKAVGVTWGFRLEQELLDYGAQWIIDHPAELIDVIGN